jgi:outer membrane protein assembly factor BamB
MKLHSSLLAFPLFCLATHTLTLTPTQAALPGMKILKLTSRTPGPLIKREFGSAVAVSETYAIVGEPAFDAGDPKPGAVHIYSAVTGAFLRTLRPADSSDNDGFGHSVAIQGRHLLVGANRRMSLGLGAAYLFDLTTGKQLRKIDAFEQADLGVAYLIHFDSGSGLETRFQKNGSIIGRLLQKGRLIANGYAGSTRITSLAFASNTTVDSTGIGGKGLGSVVSTSGAVLLRASFSDGSTRLIRVP